MRLLVVAGLVVLLLMLVPASRLGLLPQWPALRGDLQNFAHPVVFAALALLGRQAMRRSVKALRSGHHLMLAGVLVLFAALTEVLQGLTGREQSLGDFTGDLLGIGVGVLWPSRNRFARYAAAVATTLACLPLMWTLSAYSYRQAHRPLIWRADSTLLNRFARWQEGDYPGLVMTEVPADWQAYDSLVLTAHNPGAEDSSFTVRVHDAKHNESLEDRFNRSFGIAAGASGIYRIPLRDIAEGPAGRPLDLAAVAGIAIFQEGAELGPRVLPMQIRLGQ